MEIKSIMHTMQRAAPGVILVASLLTACGGGGSGGSDTSAVSSGSSQAALSSAPPTASTSNLSNPTPTASAASTSTSSTGTASTATGSFQITWIPPVARYDGSPLSPAEIDGFRIYFGKAPGSYSSQINVANGTSQSAKVTNVPAGTYYVVMTTYDVKGLESGYSPVITKTAL